MVSEVSTVAPDNDFVENEIAFDVNLSPSLTDPTNPDIDPDTDKVSESYATIAHSSKFVA